MRTMGVVGIASGIVLLVTAAGTLPASAQAPNPPIASLYDQSDRVINVAGCALACFDQVYVHSTPAYYSMDTPRNVTLVYNSRTAYPRPFVIVDVQAPSSGALPDKMSISLKVNGVPVEPLDGSAPIFYSYSDPSRPLARLKFQFDGSGYTTGRYPIEAEVQAWSGGVGSTPVLVNGHVLIVNELNSIFGAGWDVAGLQRLVLSGNDAVITEGDGSAVHFQRSCSSCAWVAPDGEFSTLTYTPGVGHTRAYPDGSEVFFPPSGYVYSVHDRFSNTTYFNWTPVPGSEWTLASIWDPANKPTSFAYSGGRLQSITDPGSPARVTHFEHSGTNLQRITSPDGKYEEFTYGVGPWAGLMSSSRSISGHVTDYGYGYARHLQVTTLPAATIADSAAPVRPKLAQQSIANMVDAMLLEGLGTSANPAPLMLAANGPYYHDARDNRTSLSLDRFGAPTGIGNWVPEVGDHNATTIYRNEHSQPKRIITPRGDDTEYFWTSVKLDSVRNNRSGQIIRYQYTTTFNDLERVWGDVAEVRHFWNATGKLDSTRVGPESLQSPRVRFWYDSYGRVTQTQDRQGNGSSYAYGPPNSWQNLVTQSMGSRQVQYEHDTYGRVKSVTDPEGNVMLDTLDAVNRPVRRTAIPAGAEPGQEETTIFIYDDDALKNWTLDANDQLYEVSYNALGWVISRTDPNLRSESYTYDLNGNLAYWTNRRGQTTSFTYDVLDRVTSRNGAGNITTYSNDIYDRFTATETQASTDTIYFDIHGRDSLAVSVRNGNAYRTLSTYDVRGRPLTQNVTNPLSAGSINYGYNDAYDWLTSLSGPHGLVAFSHDNAGQVDGTTYPTSPVIGISQTFSSIGARASVKPATPVAQLERYYTQDDNGRGMKRWGQSALREITYSGGRLQYQLDFQITSRTCTPDPEYGYHCDAIVQETPFAEQTFWWDRVGNLANVMRVDGSGFSEAGPAVTTGNRLTGMWDYTITYDYDGNMTSRVSENENRSLYWNAIGQLDSVRVGTQLSAYGYDGWGRRVSKIVSDSLTYFIWDGDQMIVEADSQHNVRARFGFAGSRPIYLTRNGDTRYYVQENPGTVTGMFNQWRQVTHSYEFWAFGEPTVPDSLEAFHNPLRFAGQYFDAETGMYYMRARYYDPRLMRFISEDPLGLDGGINPYAYAAGDPANLRDASGLEAECPDEGCPILLPGIEVSVRSWDWYYEWLDGMKVGLREIARWWNEQQNEAAAACAAEPAACEPQVAAVPSWIGGPGGAAFRTAAGQLHHVISKPIARALGRHPTLAGQYAARDPRLVTRASSLAAHRGYQTWHRQLDKRVVNWLDAHPHATQMTFETYLRRIYARSSLQSRFPNGF